MNPPYLSLWAKTAEATEGPRWHPLAYHLMDVAAVAETLLARSRFMREFAAARGIEREALSRFFLLLVALHDIGKASAHFQYIVEDAAERLGSAGFGVAKRLSGRHGEVTASYLIKDGGVSRPIADVVERFSPGLLIGLHAARIVAPIAGHHGQPVRAATIDGAAFAINKPFVAAGAHIARDLAATFGVTPLRCDWLRRDRDSAALSWFLSALIPVADWIGSRQDWFAPRDPDLDVSEYWERVARPAAARALKVAGLSLTSVSEPGAARTLPRLATPTPLQAHLLECPLAEGPALFVIEDATGSGKTEAALTLAHRLMKTGRADGFYFALPTTATADAMYARLAEGFEALFERAPDVAPSLARVHGRAACGKEQDADRSVAAYCAEWIADDRRKAFMAQGGAGTIDQALLTILPAKYQSLRLFGLHGKVLVVDEVHAFDSYVLRELTALIELHAMLGGSTIVMSATLPLATRAKLAQAHERGRDRQHSPLRERAYPLLTTVTDSGVSEQHIPLAERSRRAVRVERIAEVEEAEREVIALVKSGSAVALIRSTVDAALESFLRLRRILGEARVDILHSRFLPSDRKRIESDVLCRFGKNSTPAMRNGRVLVATQVIEQSLDVDFDSLFTDLAPIDLLIQRAGRLWRHRRDDRPVEAPRLSVISPLPNETDEANWLEASVREVGWVYRCPARLWLTARRLFDAGAIVVSTLSQPGARPDHVRSLVDAVYGADGDALPTESLRQALGKSIGDASGKAGIASHAALAAARGYGGDDRKWEAEGVVRTRLEEPRRVTVRLAQDQAGLLVPMASDGRWASSEISVTESWASDLRVPDGSEPARLSPPWSDADEGVRILVFAEGGGRALGETGVVYDAVTGLARPGKDAPTS